MTYGINTTHIQTVGTLPQTLPPLSLPSFDLENIKKLASPALAITILALTEAIAISKAIALRSGQKIDGNQEVIGQGLSNIIGSFFSAYPASGSFNRSGLNYESGAQTPLASIFAAIFLAIIILFIAPLAAYLPTAVMAAILFLVAWGLIDFHHIKEIIHAGRGETALLIITFFSTLFIELEFAIFAGVFVSIALYLRNSAKPNVGSYLPDNSTKNHKFILSEKLPDCIQMHILRIDGPIFFGSINYIDHAISEIEKKYPQKKHLLLIFASVNIIDLSGIDLLKNLVKKWRINDGDVYFTNMNDYVRETIRKGGLVDMIGEDHIFSSKPEAITSIIPQLNKKHCLSCPTKIFQECPKNK